MPFKPEFLGQLVRSRNVRSAWVKEQQIRVENDSIVEYQVNLMITFVLDEDNQDNVA